MVNRFVQSENLSFDEHRSDGLLARGIVADVPIGILKPLTYMNLSGKSVAPVARFYKVPIDKIVVIYDDLDLPTAKLRIRFKGGGGGHKGMSNIIERLGSKEFPRIRIGIGQPDRYLSPTAHVLQEFSKAEWELMTHTYDKAQQTILAIIQHGIEYAMNNFNC